MHIAIISFPGFDVINFEINPVILIKPFFCMTKKSKQNYKYLENGERFKGEIKSIFHHFKRDSVDRNCIRLKSAPLSLID